MSYSYIPLTPNSALNKHTFDVGVLIALPEELNYFLESLKTDCLDIFDVNSLESFWENEVNFTKFDLVSKKKKTEDDLASSQTQSDEVTIIQVVVSLVNEMGNEHTAMVAKYMVDTWHLPFIVNIGLTGSLDKDLKIGSVLVPSQITQYTANWKAVDTAGCETKFISGTRAFATSRLILSQFSSFLNSKEYEDWQVRCEHPKNGKPALLMGHLASGNMVIDSENFKKTLKETDRKLMGCEMEAAGFAIAEQFLQTSSRAFSQFICLRCISDMAANKALVEVDDESDGSIPPRKWAMQNATKLFLVLLKHRVIDADVRSQIDRIGRIKSDLEQRQKAAAKRSLQSESSSIEDILSKIKFQKDIKDLPENTLGRICSHFKLDSNQSHKDMQIQLIERLKNDGYFSKSKTQSELRKRSRSENDTECNVVVDHDSQLAPLRTYQDVIIELEKWIGEYRLKAEKEVEADVFLDFKRLLREATAVLE